MEIINDNIVLGVDIGGIGIKGGLIDISKGEMIIECYWLDILKLVILKVVVKIFKVLVDYFNWSGFIGVGFLVIVSYGVVLFVVNIDKSWIGINIEEFFFEVSGCKVYVLNDVDVVGVVVMYYGVGKGENGVVFMFMVGIGIGFVLFIDGCLVFNIEFGYFYMKNSKLVIEK